MSASPRLARLCAVLTLVLANHALPAQATSSVPNADEFAALHMRSIGPAQMSGRIADISGFEANPAIFYVGASHGGVWKTTNDGATFTPEFQDDGLMSIGAVRVSQKDPNLVWVGTGESNNRQSTGWGSGVWKSTDGGATWKNMGLAHSYAINRIVIDPQDDNTVLVAATGNLFGPGGDRGIYKTTDGGATWKLVLHGDASTGGNDLAMAFSDHRILFASLFERQRSQCCMDGGGPGSGIWKSTDLGETWTHLTNGLPPGDLGRIALDIYRKDPNIVYAEVATEAGAGGGRGGGGGGGGGGRGGRGAMPTGAPPKPVPDGIPSDGIYRSNDGGATWQRTANDPDNRPVYFSQVRVDPNDADHLLVASVRLYLSTDGGKNFAPVDAAVHDDKHAIWWDPNNSNHILTGGDGGAYQTWDLTRSWIWFPNIPVGLFYHVDYDLSEPFNVCGGMQDNYDWCGPSAVRSARGITNDRWQQVQGGDGFETVIDKRDPNVVYTESQDGNLTRRNKLTGESRSIRPTAANTTDHTGGGAYKFQWDTPVALSPFDPGILYVGGNKLFKSTDKGDHWTAISPDLSAQLNRADQTVMGVREADVHIAKDDGIVSWGVLT
ncbi:MAG TPA: hypothetical protein VMH39_15490, partial [Gemmatimonadaceae bacterium]|nr:hypothetical protein [Gemmatimonadaceae bacterium]